MNIETLDDMAGYLTIFDWKTNEMVLGENGEILKFKTNNEACIYCGENKLDGYLIDQIKPELRSFMCRRK